MKKERCHSLIQKLIKIQLINEQLDIQLYVIIIYRFVKPAGDNKFNFTQLVKEPIQTGTIQSSLTDTVQCHPPITSSIIIFFYSCGVYYRSSVSEVFRVSPRVIVSEVILFNKLSNSLITSVDCFQSSFYKQSVH